MAISLVTTQCCGVGELNDIGKATSWDQLFLLLEGALKEGFNWFGRLNPYSAINFTGVSKRVFRDHSSGRMDDYAKGLAEYITKNGLGEVKPIWTFENWTENEVTLWSWRPNYEALWAHIDSIKPKPQVPEIKTEDLTF